MANNRLFLVDPEYQEYIMIAKGWGSGWETWPAGHVEEKLDKWLADRDFRASASCDTKTKLILMTEADFYDLREEWKKG